MDYKTFPYFKEVDDQHIQEETKYRPIMLLNIYIYIFDVTAIHIYIWLLIDHVSSTLPMKHNISEIHYYRYIYVRLIPT